MLSRCYQAGYVRHIHHQDSADFVTDLTEFIKLYCSRISGRSGKYHLRLPLQSFCSYLIKIQFFGLPVHSVEGHIKIFPGKILFVSVRKVSPAGQIHRQHRISDVQHGKINSHISL